MSKQIDLEKLRARASGLPDSDGAIGPKWCTPTEVLELRDHIAALEKDAARYRYLTQQHGDYCITDAMENTSGVYKAGAADYVIDTAMEASNAKAD